MAASWPMVGRPPVDVEYPCPGCQVGPMDGFRDFRTAEVHFLRKGGIPALYREKRSHAFIEDRDSFPGVDIPEAVLWGS
ncbi:MAG: hypothetical protein PWP47_55 [Synergistaceae bacterium]|nr:hypothetical protein [Synergistaceae bacterium]